MLVFRGVDGYSTLSNINFHDEELRGVEGRNPNTNPYRWFKMVGLILVGVQLVPCTKERQGFFNVFSHGKLRFKANHSKSCC